MSHVEVDSIARVDIEDRLHALAVKVQDEDWHTRFVPGLHWWLAFDSTNAPKGEVTLWEQLGVSKENFNTHFNRNWKQLVASSTHPFHLFEIQHKNRIPYITVKKQDEWTIYGSSTASPNDSGAIVHRETDAKYVNRLRLAIKKKGDACQLGRAAALVEESSPDR
jgi:hypothetical protein